MTIQHLLRARFVASQGTTKGSRQDPLSHCLPQEKKEKGLWKRNLNGNTVSEGNSQLSTVWPGSHGAGGQLGKADPSLSPLGPPLGIPLATLPAPARGSPFLKTSVNLLHCSNGLEHFAS